MKYFISACLSVLLLSCSQEQSIVPNDLVGSWRMTERVLNVPSMNVVDSVFNLDNYPMVTLNFNSDSIAELHDPITQYTTDPNGEFYQVGNHYEVDFYENLTFRVELIDANTISVNHLYMTPLICDPNYYSETYQRILD